MSHQKNMFTWIASAGGLGYLPKAPGTWGTLAGIPLWYLLKDVSLGVYLASLAVLCAVACAVSEKVERMYGLHDVQWIVIDEVVGFLCTVIAVPWGVWQVCVAFAVFRVLDMFKPYPISWIDRHVKGGVGVVMDDVAAGLVGCALLHGVLVCMR
jgi:phosphatidylglycerophosphatase A